MEIYFIVTFVGEHCSWRRTNLQTSSSRKFGTRAKTNEGRGSPAFFCSRSNFRVITRLETLAMQAMKTKTVPFVPATQASRRWTLLCTSLTVVTAVWCICNRAARVVQRRQRPEAKEQRHNDMNPLDARSGLKWMFITKGKRKPNYKQN